MRLDLRVRTAGCPCYLSTLDWGGTLRRTGPLGKLEMSGSDSGRAYEGKGVGVSRLPVRRRASATQLGTLLWSNLEPLRFSGW
jgi:hypothetical protein